MRKTFAGRVAWFIPIAVVVALACSVAAYGVDHHAAASSTLVIDNSFTIKTSDPQRAFDPTASIVDRGIYDTLFTYKGGDLAHPIPLLVKSWKASKDAKTYNIQLKQNVRFANGAPLDVGRRRVLPAAAGQPEGQPGLSARRGDGEDRRALRAGALLGDAEHGAAGDPRQPVDGHRQLEARDRARRHGGRERGKGRQGRVVAQLVGVARRGQRPVRAAARSRRRRRSR